MPPWLEGDSAGSSAFQNNFCQGEIAGVTDAEAEVSRPHTFRVFARGAVEDDGRPAAGLPGHLNIPPAHSLGPAGAESFHGGFLGGKTSCVSLDSIAVAFAVGDLGRGKNALEEASAVPLDGFTKPGNLFYVHAQTNNHGTDSLLAAANARTLAAESADYTPPLYIFCGTLFRYLCELLQIE